MAPAFRKRNLTAVQTASDALAELERLNASLHDDVIEREKAILREQLSRREINVLVVGQFKRGKSSVVNALLEEDLMPTGALPVTGLSTAVRYGPTPSILVTVGGRPREIAPGELAAYVSEDENPHNRLGVVRVDVLRPIEALRGMTLYDTPGVGSIFDHNTAAARSMLPRIDAAILVVGPEPPIGAEEVAYAREVAASAVRLFVVFNKEDIAGEARDELLRFTERTLAEIAPGARVFPTSATRARIAQRRGERDPSFGDFADALHSFVAGGGDAALEESLQRRTRALLERAAALLRMRDEAAALSRAEREARRDALGVALARIDDRVRLLELAVDDDVRRLRIRLEERLGERHDNELAEFVGESERVAREPEARRREVLEEIVRTRAERWRDDAVAQARDELTRCAARYARVLAELEDDVIRAGCDVLHLPASSLEPREIAFAPARLTVAVSIDPTTSLEIVRDLLAAALPGGLQRALARRRAASVLERELDALRGKLRYGIAHDLEPWRRSVRETIASSLDATRSSVLAAFREPDDEKAPQRA